MEWTRKDLKALLARYRLSNTSTQGVIVDTNEHGLPAWDDYQNLADKVDLSHGFWTTEMAGRDLVWGDLTDLASIPLEGTEHRYAFIEILDARSFPNGIYSCATVENRLRKLIESMPEEEESDEAQGGDGGQVTPSSHLDGPIANVDIDPRDEVPWEGDPATEEKENEENEKNVSIADEDVARYEASDLSLWLESSSKICRAHVVKIQDVALLRIALERMRYEASKKAIRRRINTLT